MGSTSSDITETEFNKTWRISDRVDHLTVWENKDHPSHQLEQYYIHDYDQDNIHRLYELRKNNPYLVNGYSLTKDDLSCGTSYDSTRVFIERIPLRLSNVQDIPYPDVIHLFDVCINGFSQIADITGFFSVDEDFIGINEKGQVKVWLNTAFENSSIIGNRNVSESEMIEDVLYILFDVTDHESFPPNVPDLCEYIGAPDKTSTFEHIRDRFVSYVRQFNSSSVPLKLQCIDYAGGPHVINGWCRSNQSYGFQQNSLRVSEKVHQSKLNNSNTNQIEFDSTPPAPSVRYTNVQSIRPQLQIEPIYYRPIEEEFVVNLLPAPQTPSTAIPQTLIKLNRAQSIAISTPQWQPQIISNSISHPQQTFGNPLPTSSPSALQTLQKQASKKQINSEVFSQNDSRLQQQRVISQTIEVRQHSKLNSRGFSNPSVQNSETLIAKNSSASLANIAQQKKHYNQSKDEEFYNFAKKPIPSKMQANKQPLSSADDGRSSSDFLALLTQLKANTNNQFSQVQTMFQRSRTQIADTPTSYVKEDLSEQSRQKYFNYSNIQEAYSQQAFSSYGQNSQKVIEGQAYFDSKVSNNDSSKYSGQYSFSKYNRQIDPELEADLLRYK